MNLLLANESNCQLFKFWFHGQVADGVSCGGELFYQFHRFSSEQHDQAFDLGAKLIYRGISVIICSLEQHYLLGINLRDDWRVIEGAEKRSRIEVQGLELALDRLL